ncbi:MAG TPA: ATP-binding protein [Candidatus Sulfotelmatobacter sp.]|nr:ATP-binding protein [Candidatus Sulfotelmatobacter sp.]
MSVVAKIAWRTEEPKREQTSEELSRRFQNLFENCPIPAVLFQRQGTVKAVNPAFQCRFEIGPNANRPLQFTDVFQTGGSSAQLREFFNGERESCELLANDSSNSGHHVHWTAWRLHAAGASPHFIAIEKGASAGMDRHQSERLQFLGRVAGGVAHDFNNLLSGVLLYCDLLLAAVDSGNRARKYAEEIRNSALQATGLVRQLLTAAKPQRPEPRLISLNEIADSLRNLLSHLVGENIQLTFRLDRELGLVKIDPSQAQQIILNLVLNARDAMPRGGEVVIETRNCHVQVLLNDGRRDSARTSLPCALLVVQDKGAGMDATTREKVFEPFFTTKDEKGTGLGLATVHEIVMTSGGLIHVDSEPGRGTRMSILLPLQPTAASPSGDNNFHPVMNGEAPSSKTKNED